jgi:hypothetical protein
MSSTTSSLFCNAVLTAILERFIALRDPGLFSVIAAAWQRRAKSEGVSQDSGNMKHSEESYNTSQVHTTIRQLKAHLVDFI